MTIHTIKNFIQKMKKKTHLKEKIRKQKSNKNLKGSKKNRTELTLRIFYLSLNFKANLCYCIIAIKY